MPGRTSWPGCRPRAPGAAAGHLRRRRGLIGAAERVLDRSLPQRGLIPRARNLLAKVPTQAQDEVKAASWASFDDIEQPPGEQAVAEAQRRAQAFADRYQRAYPAAVAWLLHTLPELTCYLRFPTEHWSRIRPSNLIERTFGETRRRTR
jgi:putative transposase